MNFNYSISGGGPSGMAAFGIFFVVVGWVVFAIIHIAFAVAVYRDADRLSLSDRLLFVSPFIWCLVTLVGGMTSAAIYWVLHHSRLNPDVPVVAAVAPTTDTLQSPL
jgi:hypothetical protein